jgi:hypothetical protein
MEEHYHRYRASHVDNNTKNAIESSQNVSKTICNANMRQVAYVLDEGDHVSMNQH